MVDPLHSTTAAAAVGDDDDLVLFDHSVDISALDCLEGFGEGEVIGEDEEEEELEWISNSDAFPSLETSFEHLACNDVGAQLEALGTPRGPRSKRPRRSRMVQVPVMLPEKNIRRTAKRKRRRCLHCEVEDTPQWREGPQGPKTLCNACGVRYRSGRLFPEYRPAASPTFSPSLHSNSHRRVLELRRRHATVETRN